MDIYTNEDKMTNRQRSLWIITDNEGVEAPHITFDSFKTSILKKNPTGWINTMSDETFGSIEDYLEMFRLPSEGEIKSGDTIYFIQHAYFGTEEELQEDFFKEYWNDFWKNF